MGRKDVLSPIHNQGLPPEVETNMPRRGLLEEDKGRFQHIQVVECNFLDGVQRGHLRMSHQLRYLKVDTTEMEALEEFPGGLGKRLLQVLR